MMISGASLFFNAFLFYQNDYQCFSMETECNSYVCSLPVDKRASFLKEDLKSLASNFGDYRCENSYELDIVQSFIYIGGIIGVVVGSFLS
jgi:hypothetical protein